MGADGIVTQTFDRALEKQRRGRDTCRIPSRDRANAFPHSAAAEQPDVCTSRMIAKLREIEIQLNRERSVERRTR